MWRTKGNLNTARVEMLFIVYVMEIKKQKIMTVNNLHSLHVDSTLRTEICHPTKFPYIIANR